MLAMISPPRGMGGHGYEVSTKKSVGIGTLASAWALPSATVAGNAKKVVSSLSSAAGFWYLALSAPVEPLGGAWAQLGHRQGR